MKNFTELENLQEIKDLLPNEKKIRAVHGINVEPEKIRIYGKMTNNLDFVFELMRPDRTLSLLEKIKIKEESL